MALKDPKLDLRGFLRTNVATGDLSIPFDANTQIDIADYDGGISTPSVALGPEDTIPVGGGPTGYTGMDGGGAGPTQDLMTSIAVDCWGGNERTDVLVSNDVDPDTVANELAQVVWDAIHDNSGDLSGYDRISVTEAREANDDRSSPTEYRRKLRARLFYERRPD